MNCAEMAEAMPQQRMHNESEPSDEQGCCPDMTQGCLVAMNCLSPLAITGASTQQLASFRLEPIYLPVTEGALESEPPAPESPPPQPSLIA